MSSWHALNFLFLAANSCSALAFNSASFAALSALAALSLAALAFLAAALAAFSAFALAASAAAFLAFLASAAAFFAACIEMHAHADAQIYATAARQSNGCQVWSLFFCVLFDSPDCPENKESNLRCGILGILGPLGSHLLSVKPPLLSCSSPLAREPRRLCRLPGLPQCCRLFRRCPPGRCRLPFLCRRASLRRIRPFLCCRRRLVCRSVLRTIVR